MKKLSILICLILLSCLSELPTSPEFNINLDDIDLSTLPLADSVKLKMNGIYEVRDGSDLLGDAVVGKWINQRWCLYSNHDVVYSENIGGSTDDSTLEFTGYIRIIRSGSGTRIDLKINPSEGGTELLEGNTPNSIIFKGETTSGNKIELRRIRNLHTPNDTTKKFHIIAHRGGGRNAERLGFSENSIEMIKHAEILGATGIEIDVKRTRDGKLILFHDPTFSPRTVKGTYLLGKVENFDLAQIQTFGRLYYGEEIPTLEKALRVVVENTSLSLVWLDVKDASIVDNVITAQLAAMNLASEKGRNVDILLGVPVEEILNAYISSTLEKTPILIELQAGKALSYITCKVWAPRWTNGIPTGEIENMHTNNKLVFTWTLDVKEFIEDFVYVGQIDGILSNYPSQVAGIYYTQN